MTIPMHTIKSLTWYRLKSCRFLILSCFVGLLLCSVVFCLRKVQANHDLASAIVRGDAIAVRQAIDQGAELEKLAAGTNLTPLQVAAGIGQTEVVLVLLERGASINQPDIHGNTALMLAATNGHLAVVSTLLSHGADVKARHFFGGSTALSQATNSPKRSERTAIIALLQQAEASN